MTADQISVYTIVLMLQYDRGAPVLYVGREREIAVRSGLTVGRLRTAVKHLIELGKLCADEACGTLSNRRAAREIGRIEQKLAENKENSQKGGAANKAKWDKKRNDINDPESHADIQSDSRNIALLPPSPVPLSEDPSDLCPKPDKPVRTRNVYPADFEDFWSAYPTDSNMPKAEAFKQWKRLTEDERRDATASIPAFKRYCASHPDYRPVHAERYLSQRRWEGHLKTAAAVAKRVFVHRDSPQWTAWVSYLKAHGRSSPPIDQNGGWMFESEWPPRANQDVHERATA